MRSRYLPGDVVARRKGIVLHKGIALGDGTVLHNIPFRGEHVCSEDEFRAGHRLQVIPLAYDARQRALAHARSVTARRSYNLFTNNCEHTVTRLTSGRPSSPQLRGFLLGVAAGAVALAVTRHPGAAAASFAAAQRLAGRLF